MLKVEQVYGTDGTIYYRTCGTGILYKNMQGEKQNKN